MDNQNSPAANSRKPIIWSVVGVGVFLSLLISTQSSVLAQITGNPSGLQKVTTTEKDDDAQFDHSVFDALLKAHVDADGWIDYAAFQRDQVKLDAYLEAIKQADMEQLGKGERLAFLINSYNAFTIKLLVENYPLDSINDIPEANRWDGVRWNLAGNIVSLNQIEHEYVRQNFNEPRIHFALVCGAVGCPPLRNEAFIGETLEAQLAAQSTYVHNHGTWFQYDERRNQVGLTKLYNWYGDDFIKTDGSILQFIKDNSDKLANVDAPNVVWLDYDWTLNDVSNRAAR